MRLRAVRRASSGWPGRHVQRGWRSRACVTSVAVAGVARAASPSSTLDRAVGSSWRDECPGRHRHRGSRSQRVTRQRTYRGNRLRGAPARNAGTGCGYPPGAADPTSSRSGRFGGDSGAVFARAWWRQPPEPSAWPAHGTHRAVCIRVWRAGAPSDRTSCMGRGGHGFSEVKASALGQVVRRTRTPLRGRAHRQRERQGLSWLTLGPELDWTPPARRICGSNERHR